MTQGRSVNSLHHPLTPLTISLLGLSYGDISVIRGLQRAPGGLSDGESHICRAQDISLRAKQLGTVPLPSAQMVAWKSFHGSQRREGSEAQPQPACSTLGGTPVHSSLTLQASDLSTSGKEGWDLPRIPSPSSDQHFCSCLLRQAPRTTQPYIVLTRKCAQGRPADIPLPSAIDLILPECTPFVFLCLTSETR